MACVTIPGDCAVLEFFAYPFKVRDLNLFVSGCPGTDNRGTWVTVGTLDSAHTLLLDTGHDKRCYRCIDTHRCARIIAVLIYDYEVNWELLRERLRLHLKGKYIRIETLIKSRKNVH